MVSYTSHPIHPDQEAVHRDHSTLTFHFTNPHSSQFDTSQHPGSPFSESSLILQSDVVWNLVWVIPVIFWVSLPFSAGMPTFSLWSLEIVSSFVCSWFSLIFYWAQGWMCSFQSPAYLDSPFFSFIVLLYSWLRFHINLRIHLSLSYEHSSYDLSQLISDPPPPSGYEPSLLPLTSDDQSSFIDVFSQSPIFLSYKLVHDLPSSRSSLIIWPVWVDGNIHSFHPIRLYI